jgi:hypothetical protein
MRRLLWSYFAASVWPAITLSMSIAAGQVPPVNSPAGLRQTWQPDQRDPLTDAVRVWRRGVDSFDGNAPSPRGSGRTGGHGLVLFTGIDLQTRDFLRHPNLKPVVQFSCARVATPYEDALEEVLAGGTPEVRLQALAVLMRLRAPSSVALQWKVLNELRLLDDRPAWQPLLVEWASCFEPGPLMKKVREVPPQDRYDNSAATRPYLWSIRALGVIGHREALPRLAELSRSDHLYTSLAAERSIEDFTGPEAERALVECLLGWQYDAYVRAGHALLDRNRDLLRAALRSADPPEGRRYWQGIFLARCDDPAAVPILCQAAPNVALVDREIFAHIARLGQAEHRTMIESLLRRVRKDQRELAEKTVSEYLRRIETEARQAP